MINLSPDIVKLQEATTHLAEAKNKQQIQFSEALLKYDTIPDLPTDLNEMRTKLEAIEKLLVTNDPSITPKMREQYVTDYETYMARAIPYLEKEIAKLKDIMEDAQTRGGAINNYLRENKVTYGFAKEQMAISNEYSKNYKNANIKRIKLEAALAEIVAGPQVGHCTIENKSPEVLKVEKYLQLEMVGSQRSYNVSTIVNKYASMLARKRKIKTYCAYTKGNNLYFTYVNKKTGNVYLNKFQLTEDEIEDMVMKKKTGMFKREGRWKLPDPSSVHNKE